MADAVVEGRLSGDDLDATRAQLDALDVDLTGVLDALHVPEDAGEWAASIERILRRIPDGWGRWLRVDRGWYPLVCGVDEQLAAIDRDYVVHQVKEKFGTLRYYFTPSDRATAHIAEMERIVAEAELRSSEICEHTGAPGITMSTVSGWLATLDPAAAPNDYTLISADSSGPWWDAIKRSASDDSEAWMRLAELQHSRAVHLEVICQRLLDALRAERGGPAS
jgi:hypothetical protein